MCRADKSTRLHRACLCAFEKQMHGTGEAPQADLPGQHRPVRDAGERGKERTTAARLTTAAVEITLLVNFPLLYTKGLDSEPNGHKPAIDWVILYID